MLGSIHTKLERIRIVNDRKSVRSLIYLALTVSLVAVGALFVLSGFFSHCNTTNIISTTASVLSTPSAATTTYTNLLTTSAASAINTTTSTLLNTLYSAIATVNNTTSALINSTNMLNASTSTVSSLNSTLLSTIYSSISTLNQTTASIISTTLINTTAATYSTLNSTLSALLSSTDTAVATINQTINVSTTVTSAISSLTSTLVSLAESASTVLSLVSSTILNATAATAINATTSSLLNLTKYATTAVNITTSAILNSTLPIVSTINATALTAINATVSGTVQFQKLVATPMFTITSTISSCCNLVYMPMLMCAFVIVAALILTYTTIRNYKKQKTLMLLGHKKIKASTTSKASCITLALAIVAICIVFTVALPYKYMNCLLQTMCIPTFIGICTIQVALIAVIIMSMLLILSTKKVTIIDSVDACEMKDLLERGQTLDGVPIDDIKFIVDRWGKHKTYRYPHKEWLSTGTTLNFNGLPTTAL